MREQETSGEGLHFPEKFDILVNAGRAMLVMERMPGRSSRAVLTLFGPRNMAVLRKNDGVEIGLADMSLAGFEVLQRVSAVTVIELEQRRMVGQYEARIDPYGEPHGASGGSH